MADGGVGAITGLIPTVVGLAVLKKTSEMFLGKENKFPKQHTHVSKVFKK